MTRTARCQCGALSVEVEGAQEAVVACSCSDCQRRTGPVFGLGAYYARDKVRISGEAREFARAAESGSVFRSYFCPSCGTSLYFFSERDPNRIGVAIGGFADPQFPAPDRSVYDASKHHWVQFGEATPGFERGRNSPRSR